MNCKDCNVELSAYNTGENKRCTQYCKWKERVEYHQKRISDFSDLLKIRQKNVAQNKARAKNKAIAKNQQAIQEIEEMKKNW